MAETTGIAWTDSTFNPWIGCTKVSPGCDHCYAEALDKRHRWGGKVHWGVGVPRHRTSEAQWHHPVAWNAKPFFECLSCHHRFAPARKDGYVVCPQCSGGKRLGDLDEASAVKQVSRRVFCASLADVFDNEVPDEWRADLFDLIRATPNLTWLLLTKRIGNAAKMIYGYAPWRDFAPRNVWLGASVVNQEEADRDIPKLLATPAAKRFVSYEPALGPVDFARFLDIAWSPTLRLYKPLNGHGGRAIDWLIVGGESTQGAKARPFDVNWAVSTVSQCKAAGAAVFVKQLGSNPFSGEPHTSAGNELVAIMEDGPGWRLKDRAGADPEEWPENLRVQNFPA